MGGKLDHSAGNKALKTNVILHAFCLLPPLFTSLFFSSFPPWGGHNISRSRAIPACAL